jgi:hypothetical protein
MLASNKHSIRFGTFFHFITYTHAFLFLYPVLHRLVQQIIDAILVLDIEDPHCAIAAGALLFVLASDVCTS